MKRIRGLRVPGLLALAACAALPGCRTLDLRPSSPATAETTAAEAPPAPPRPGYRRKVAVGAFVDEVGYRGGAFVSQSDDPLGDLAFDLLVSQLWESDAFLPLERRSMRWVRSGGDALVGIDTLVLGAIRTLERSSEVVDDGIFEGQRRVVRLSVGVEVRLVEVDTGLLFFTGVGFGEVARELHDDDSSATRTAAGIALNEDALSLAIREALEPVQRELQRRPWRSFVLAAEGDRVFIGGGSDQGLAVGDELVAVRAGRTVASPQTGEPVDLPGRELARLRVVAHFAEGTANEGSTCEVLSGSLAGADLQRVYVRAADPALDQAPFDPQ